MKINNRAFASLLVEKYGTQWFTRKDVIDDFQLHRNSAFVKLKRMGKTGYVEMRKSKDDARKNLYRVNVDNLKNESGFYIASYVDFDVYNNILRYCKLNGGSIADAVSDLVANGVKYVVSKSGYLPPITNPKEEEVNE